MTGLPAARLGDTGSGHDCHYPSTQAVEGSHNVFINGRPAVRVGDAYAAHGCNTCSAPAHGRKLAEGAPTVFINGKPAGRIGDAIDCGGFHITGSPNVFIGNSSPTGDYDPFEEECPFAKQAE